jgi:hypothetical protein
LLGACRYIQNLNEYVPICPATPASTANISSTSTLGVSNDTLFIDSAGLYSRYPTLFWKNPIRMSLPSYFCINTHSEMYRVTSQFEKYVNGRVSEIVAIKTVNLYNIASQK